MADSNTKQQTTPTDSLPSSSTITDPRKKELFELARKKIVRADVASDGKVDQKDNELRTQALEFVAKECLGLPEKQLLKLVKKIVESLEKKEVEKNALLAEMKAVHTSTVADIERVGAGRHVWNKIRGAYEVAAEKTVDVLGNGDGKIAKFVQDRELHSGARKEMFRSMFALAGYDFKQSATHLHFYMETEAKRAEFTQEISKEAKCVIGFCTNWSEKHPVYEQLVKMGLKTVADKVTIERNVMRINNPKWIEGDKAEAAIKTKLDIENGYRKKHYVFENEFQPSIKPKESADFIESLVHSNRKKSKGEFLEDLKADPHAMAGLIFHWKPGHPTIKELENRGDKVALKYMEEVRSEALVKCKIEPNAINKDYKEHRKYVWKIIINDINKDDKGKIESAELLGRTEKLAKSMYDEVRRLRKANNYNELEKFIRATDGYFKDMEKEISKVQDQYYREKQISDYPESLRKARMVQSGAQGLFNSFERNYETSTVGALKDMFLRDIYDNTDWKAKDEEFKGVLAGKGYSRIDKTTGKPKDPEVFRKRITAALQIPDEGARMAALKDMSPIDMADYISNLRAKSGGKITRSALYEEWGSSAMRSIATIGKHWGISAAGGWSGGIDSKAYKILSDQNNSAGFEFYQTLSSEIREAHTISEFLTKGWVFGKVIDAFMTNSMSGGSDKEAIRTKLSALTNELKAANGDPVKETDALAKHFPKATIEDFKKLVQGLSSGLADQAKITQKRAESELGYHKHIDCHQGFKNVFAKAKVELSAKNNSSTQEDVAFLTTMQAATVQWDLQNNSEKFKRLLSIVEKYAGNDEKSKAFVNFLKTAITAEASKISSVTHSQIANDKVALGLAKDGENRTAANDRKYRWIVEAKKAKAEAKVTATNLIEAQERSGDAESKAKLSKLLDGKDPLTALSDENALETLGNRYRTLEKITEGNAFDEIFKTNRAEDRTNVRGESALTRMVAGFEKNSNGGAFDKFEAASAKPEGIQKFYDSAKTGETVQISDSIDLKKTEIGIEIKNDSGRTLKFGEKEVAGALTMIALLKDAGLESFVPMMRELAETSGADFKNSISKTEASSILNLIAKRFGIANVVEEADLESKKSLLERGMKGSLDGKTLATRLRDHGLVNPGGNLRTEVFGAFVKTGESPAATKGTLKSISGRMAAVDQTKRQPVTTAMPADVLGTRG